MANKVSSSGSLPVMRPLEPVRVTVLEGQVPTLLFAGPLLLEMLLSHHVQVSVHRQPPPAPPLPPSPQLRKPPASSAVLPRAAR